MPHSIGEDNKRLEKWRKPGDPDYENARLRRKAYMQQIARNSAKGNTSRKKGAATKMSKDPDYFRNLRLRRRDLNETDR